jgi:ATP-binding cassette subfamily F protein uup
VNVRFENARRRCSSAARSACGRHGAICYNCAVSVLGARGLGKSYGPQTLFSNASLAIQEGERVGLLGLNGAGKSTLLKVLAGIEQADEGVVEQRRGARVLYLTQEPRFPEASTPREIVEQGLAEWHAAIARHAEVTALIEEEADEARLLEQAQLGATIERLGGWEQGHRAIEMLQRLGVRAVDQPIGSMSGGEQRRVALARLLIAQPELAILDEPTNHLDVDTIEYLEDYLRDRFTGAVLLVTHDRYVLDAVADRILELERGVLREYRGNYSSYLEQKEELLAHADRAEQNRLNLVRRERAWLQRGAKARTTKQKARIQRAEELIGREPAPAAQRAELTQFSAGAARSGKTVLAFDDVELVIAERTLIAGLTLHLVAGDRVGVVGPNGAGKTSLLKLISGELAPTRGEVVRGANTRLAYFDQARAQLRDDWSVLENVAERQGAERDGGGQVKFGSLTLDLRSYLERFLFDGGKQRQPVGALSGGERARVALAKTLRSGANLLLLDEPTNDLDIAVLGELEELLLVWSGSAIIVSHDRSFLDRVATAILAFEPNGSVLRYEGGYESYRSQRPDPSATATRRDEAEPVRRPAGQAAIDPPRGRERASAPAKPLSQKERRELDGLFDKIAEAEARVAALASDLSSKPAQGQSADAVRKVRADYDTACTQVTELTKRWEELEARRE